MDKLLEGLQQFQSGYFSENRNLFEQLAHGQHPRVLFITCSDSRIDPNLITQAQVGELFVIRNAGNIIPPYGAANGGEGASIEYAITALDIDQIIVCGHSHCGAMKALFKLNALQEKLPLVYDWLKHAEATRRLIVENYSHLEGEELIEMTVAENVLTQLENLQTYPVIRSKLRRGALALHGWIYRLEAGIVLSYDGVLHDFVAPQSRLPNPVPDYALHPSCPLSTYAPFTVNSEPTLLASSPKPTKPSPKPANSTLPGYAHLSAKQANRIYRGSN